MTDREHSDAFDAIGAGIKWLVRPTLVMAVAFAICASAIATPPKFAPTTFAQQEPAATQDPIAAIDLAQTATSAQNAEDYAVAVGLWEELIRDYPTTSLVGKAHYNAGVCYVFQNPPDYRKAMNQFGKSIPKLASDSATQLPQAYLYLGFSQYRLGQQLKQQSAASAKQEAIELLTTSTQSFETVISKHGEFEDVDQACFFQGGAFEELGRLEEADKSYAQMLTYPKQTYKLDGLFAIANVNEQLGNFSRALKFYGQYRDEAEKLGGSDALDEVLFRTAKTMLAFAAADQANQVDPQQTRQNFEKAEELFGELASKPTAGRDQLFQAIVDESQFQQAFCQTQLGDFESAGELYDQVASRPNSAFQAQALVFAGRCYAKAGDDAQAVNALAKSLEMDSPFAIEGARSLAAIYLRLGNQQKVIEIANEWIDKDPDGPQAANLMMDRADATYQTPARKSESPELYLQIATKFPRSELAPLAIYNAAFAYLEMNQPDLAIQTAQLFEQNYADHEFLADTLEVKADALLVQDKPVDAEQAFDQLVAKFPENPKVPRWIVRSALAKYIQQKYQPAIELISANLSRMNDPQQKAEALHWLGSSHFSLEDYESAQSNLQASLDADRNWGRADETLLTLARAALKNDSPDQGKAVAEELVRDFPNSPLIGDAFYYLGESDYQTGNYSAALERFNTVIGKHADSRLLPYSLYNAAWCQLKLEQFGDSETLFTRLITDFPSHELAERAKMDRGATRRKTGKMKGSIADLKAFLDSNPTGKPKFNALWELGLTQVEEQLWSDAIATFTQLLNEDKQSDKTDRYHYELAWAYQSANQPEQALQQFAAIAKELPSSPLAAEANFHVGTAFYQDEKFGEAIEAYQKCVDSSAEDTVREKAAYKLAWAHYKQEQFADAARQFARQTELFPTGDLYADGVFMVAESQFRLKNHPEAFAAYLVAKPAVDASGSVDPKLKLLTRLHGAQSANKTREYAQALELVRPLTTEEGVDPGYQQDAWLEIGTAEEGLGNDDKALDAWTKAYEGSINKTAARARCMTGDLFFRQRKFSEAIEEFKRVYYGFGGIAAPDDIRPWQAYALYEAARCNFVQVNDAPDELKPKLIDEAIKQFEALVTNYPNDRLAPEAAKQLETLKKLRSN